jgi:hypothetical protein
MAMLKFELPNPLPLEEARPRVEALVSYWQRKYGVRATWDGPRAHVTGKTMGVTIEARLEITPGKVLGEATDPGLLLRGQAQKYLQRKFSQYLDAGKTLAQLLAAET